MNVLFKWKENFSDVCEKENKVLIDILYNILLMFIYLSLNYTIHSLIALYIFRFYLSLCFFNYLISFS